MLPVLTSSFEIQLASTALYLDLIDKQHMKRIRPDVEMLYLTGAKIASVRTFVLGIGADEESQDAFVAENLLADT